MNIEAFILGLLMYGVVPLWIAVGALDWWCHLRSHIATTAGPKESWIHLLMFAQVGVPMVAALLLEVNALVIGLMCICFVLHEATALWDVRYATATRVVSPFEQRVHSYLELLPLLAGTLLLSLHHEQALALFGLGSEPARFELALKDPALPWPYVVAVLGAAGLFNLGPYLAELRRGLRAQHAEALKRPCQLKDAGSKATREG